MSRGVHFVELWLYEHVLVQKPRSSSLLLLSLLSLMVISLLLLLLLLLLMCALLLLSVPSVLRWKSRLLWIRMRRVCLKRTSSPRTGWDGEDAWDQGTEIPAFPGSSQVPALLKVEQAEKQTLVQLVPEVHSHQEEHRHRVRGSRRYRIQKLDANENSLAR